MGESPNIPMPGGQQGNSLLSSLMGKLGIGENNNPSPQQGGGNPLLQPLVVILAHNHLG